MMKHLNPLVFFGVSPAMLAAFFIPVHLVQATAVAHEPLHVSTASNCAPGSSILSAMATVSNKDAWTVGYCLNKASTGNQTLTEHWNGSQWTIVTSPTVPSARTELVSVAAISSKDVWAVGRAFTKTGLLTATEHWNRSQWTIITSPNIPSMPINLLKAVEGRSSNDVWAVGYFSTNGTNEAQTLTEHWNGSSWTIIPG